MGRVMNEFSDAGRQDVSVVDTIIAAIIAAIREGRFVGGQRLIEADFARGLSVSRSAVREAFQRLAADGLLTVERHRGVSVREWTRKEVSDLFTVRRALEGLAAELATPVIAADPSEVLALRAALDAAVASGDLGNFSRVNEEFHALVVNAAGNAILADVLGKLGHSIYRLQFRVVMARQAAFESNKQHHEMIDAFVANDSKRAREIAEDHVSNAAQLVQMLPDSYFGGTMLASL